jgi:RIO kinase 1
MRMLCAGVVHGDLSVQNILLASEDGVDGPVIIDLPRAVDATGNNHAKRMLLRDVDNLHSLASSPPTCCPAATAKKSGRSMKTACCRPTPPLTRALHPETGALGGVLRKLTTPAPRKARGSANGRSRWLG